MKNKDLIAIPSEIIQNKIYFIRGKKVMFDYDLANLYGVETRRLNEAVKRNNKRFPEDFMFQLNKQEILIWKSYTTMATLSLKSQFATSSWGGTRKAPLVFTEQGVAMLSSVLNSDRAIQVNIQIMRTFTKIREFLSTHKELREKIENLEKKYKNHDSKLQEVFDAIKMLSKDAEKPKGQIGFRVK